MSQLKLIPFNGDKETWWAWKHRFMSVAVSREYDDLFKLKPDQIPDADDNMATNRRDPKMTDELIELRKEKNKRAMTDLQICMTHQTSSMIVWLTRTEEYEYGNFPEAWSKLEKKYEPRTSEDKCNLEDEFASRK
jgi:hypothetical protein